MEFSIKTEKLQEMVGKASKCVSNNKLIPITSLISIGVENNQLVLITTDATNYFKTVAEDKVDCENFEVAVLADTFTRLIQKTTSDNVSLSLEGNSLKIKGNGTYTMELIMDESGLPVKFPKKWADETWDASLGVIKLSTVNTILNYNKPSLAVSLDVPALTSYYCGDKVVTSDSFKICSTAVKVFDKPLLISSRLMDILSIMSEEDINISSSDKALLFHTKTDLVYAPITEGIESFPIDAISGLVDSDFPSTCKIPRVAVLEIIERLSLFVSPYDKKGINLTFTKDGVMFSSKKSSGVELVPYASSDNFKDYTCCIDIELLRSQIATQDNDYIELSYGSEIAIKMVTNNVTQIVALMMGED